jgi:hypothetical protein
MGELLAFIIITADERFDAERYVCGPGEGGEVAAPREAAAAPCRYERRG